ncbi:MAG: response regulator [Chitinophagaceae bacterium]|nr:MAG: response regulator [Chitinophagaceae bacterium]
MKRILIVDDNLENREILGLLFEDEGFEVRLLTGPEQIELELISFAPGVVLMDVMMAGYNGIQVCQLLKSNALFAHIPIVLMTASNALKDVDLLVSMADAYVYKPFDIDDVAKMINSLVQA